MTKLSRRVFLGSAPAAAAAAGVFGTLFSSAAEAAINWDDTYNVIVIGAGGAGLSAAVSAKEAGCKKVVVLEKMMFAGGNTIRAGGGFNAAIKADYEKAGIKDSPDLHAQQTLAAGDGRGDPVLVHQLTEKAPESVQWLKDHGVKFEDHIYQIYAGLYKRARNPIGPRGGAYIKALLEVCKKEDIPILYNTRVVEIIREHQLSGRVLGVKVEQKGGKTLYLRALNGVVAAAGGFAANDRLTAIHDPRMGQLDTTNHPGATGDVLIDLVDIGPAPAVWITSSASQAEFREKNMLLTSSRMLTASCLWTSTANASLKKTQDVTYCVTPCLISRRLLLGQSLTQTVLNS